MFCFLFVFCEAAHIWITVKCCWQEIAVSFRLSFFIKSELTALMIDPSWYNRLEPHTGPVFHNTDIFRTFWHKNGLFQTHKSGKNLTLFKVVSVSATYPRKSWELVLPALLRNELKQTFKWSYRWNRELKVKTFIKQISWSATFICFNQFTRRYNTFRRGGGMVAGFFLTVFMGDVTLPT